MGLSDFFKKVGDTLRGAAQTVARTVIPGVVNTFFPPPAPAPVQQIAQNSVTAMAAGSPAMSAVHNQFGAFTSQFQGASLARPNPAIAASEATQDLETVGIAQAGFLGGKTGPLLVVLSIVGLALFAFKGKD